MLYYYYSIFYCYYLLLYASLIINYLSNSILAFTGLCQALSVSHSLEEVSRWKEPSSGRKLTKITEFSLLEGNQPYGSSRIKSGVEIS